MKPIEIPIEDINDIDLLGDNPIYRFEELLNETSRNDLETVIDKLELDIDSDEIDDYEIYSDKIILYVDDEE